MNVEDKPSEAGWHPHPDLPGTQRYWDGTRWTEDLAPLRSSTGRSPKTDPVFAWTIALIPMAWVPLAYVVPKAAVSVWTLVAAVVLSILVALADVRRLQTAGVEIGSSWPVLLGGVYLVDRTRRTRSMPLLPVVWVAGAVFSVIASLTFAAVYSVDGGEVETTLKSWLKDQGIKRAKVSCPDDFFGHRGDTFECTARSFAGDRGVFKVTLQDDDEVTFKLQG